MYKHKSLTWSILICFSDQGSCFCKRHFTLRRQIGSHKSKGNIYRIVKEKPWQSEFLFGIRTFLDILEDSNLIIVKKKITEQNIWMDLILVALYWIDKEPLMRRSIRSFIIPHGDFPGTRTFADWSVQIPRGGGGGKKCVRTLHLSSGFDGTFFFCKKQNQRPWHSTHWLSFKA